LLRKSGSRDSDRDSTQPSSQAWAEASQPQEECQDKEEECQPDVECQLVAEAWEEVLPLVDKDESQARVRSGEI